MQVRCEIMKNQGKSAGKGKICSNLDVKAQKLYSYELHHDTLQIDEVIYDDANRIQKVPATTRYATVNSTHDTLTIRQKGKPVRRYVPSK